MLNDLLGMFEHIKNLFSERKGFTSTSNIVLRDEMSEEVKNAILSCYCRFCQSLTYTSYRTIPHDIDEELWTHFLNKNLRDFSDGHRYFNVFEPYIKDDQIIWYQKLDMLEYVCRWLSKRSNFGSNYLNDFEKSLNFEFERLNYGYRIVNHRVMEITSDEEIECIETALKESKDNVRIHIDSAINFYSDKQNPDYRNSIKESITAVEAVCRELTGEDDLNKALKNLNTKGVPIHDRFKDGIRSFYNFTNQPDTGIRHALMEDGYNPSKAEAYFMLVSCSAFVNYLRMISSKS
ncbi:MAG: hypothetical protein IKQ08_08960 [Paludibacteraceae bacterium]|nr:hypothetical protein [Paludibacteraceae bacterium]